MLIVGYKNGVNFIEVASVIKKHTNMQSQTINSIIKEIRDGKAVSLPDDFVLKEDLIDLKILVG